MKRTTLKSGPITAARMTAARLPARPADNGRRTRIGRLPAGERPGTT